MTPEPRPILPDLADSACAAPRGHSLSRRRWGQGLLAAAAGWGLAGCAGLGGPRTLVLSEADIARVIDRRFPVDRRVLEVLEVTLSAPRVSLLPQSNRLATVMEVRASDLLFGRGTRGRLALDYALRLEPSDTSVRLTQVRVNELSLEGLASVVRAPAMRVGALLAEELLDDATIWQLRSDQADTLRLARARATAVTVTARGVEITLAPA